MAARTINQVTLTGYLTRDPRLRTLPSGEQVADLRLAGNGRRRDPDTGQWADKPLYFDVAVFGTQVRSVTEHMCKGKPIAVQGRLHWREWEDQHGERRQMVSVIADLVQFIGDPPRGDGHGQSTDEPYAERSHGTLAERAHRRAARRSGERLPHDR